MVPLTTYGDLSRASWVIGGGAALDMEAKRNVDRLNMYLPIGIMEVQEN